MASPTRWTWVWASSRSWWWTGMLGVLQSMGSQRVGHNWVTELEWFYFVFSKEMMSLPWQLRWQQWAHVTLCMLCWLCVTEMLPYLMRIEEWSVIYKLIILQKTQTVTKTKYLENLESPYNFQRLYRIINTTYRIYVCICIYVWAYLCYTYIAAATAKSLQSCPTLCDPIDGSPPGPAIPGILQARTLQWVAISSSNTWKWKVKGKSLSRVRLLATPWTAAYQAPRSMGFSRQEYWIGVPLPSPIMYTLQTLFIFCISHRFTYIHVNLYMCVYTDYMCGGYTLSDTNSKTKW